jgi:hypothetical protein
MVVPARLYHDQRNPGTEFPGKPQKYFYYPDHNDSVCRFRLFALYVGRASGKLRQRSRNRGVEQWLKERKFY